MKCTTLSDWSVCSSLDTDIQDNVILAKQVHGNTIRDANEIIHRTTEADGIVARKESSLCAGVVTADCMPLVLIAQDSSVILHISRKSLISGLLDYVPHVINTKAIQHVWIGNHICHKHFQFYHVGPDIQQFIKLFPRAVHENGNILHISLVTAVKSYFIRWNLPKSSVMSASACTYKNKTLISYRRWLVEGKKHVLNHTITWVNLKK